MKSLIVALLAGISSLVFAQEVLAVNDVKDLSREERRRASLLQRAERLKANGGLVTRPHSGNFARVVSAQRKVPLTEIKEYVRQFNTGLNIWIEVSELEPEKTSWHTLEAALKLPKTGLLLLIVDDATLPRILSAFEEGWSILNVRSLDSDLPPSAVYKERVRKEVNRAFAQCAGAGISLNRPCVMEPAFTLAQLDAIKFPVVSPEAMSKISESASKRLVPPIWRSNYRKACQEGWAPAPTNDIQKAIWDKVHAMPTAPLTIKPETKKVEK